VKIRTHLLLSYLGLILLIIAGMTFLSSYIMTALTARNAAEAEEAVKHLASANYKLSEQTLTDLGERFVRTKSREVAALLSLQLRGRDLKNYDQLRHDPELRFIATGNILAAETIAGHVDVLDDTGTAVWHPNRSVEGKNYVEWKVEFPEMWRLVERSFRENEVHGYYTFINRDQQPAKKYMALTRVQGTPFIVAAVVEISHFFVPVHEKMWSANELSQAKARKAIETATGSTLEQGKWLGGIGAAIVLILGGFFGFWFAGSISKPIMRLKDGVGQIGQGNFSVEVPERGAREVKELAQSFNHLGKQLTEYIENLTRATADRQRLESELAIAAEIQQSLVPTAFLPSADHEELEIFAVMHPAREVGGDFYDFFFVDDEHIYFAIGDVCGKGMPAALLMAVTKSLIETSAGQTLDPGQVLRLVNGRLAQNNEKCVFVTVFCGILNVSTGELVYANGGHDLPIVVEHCGSTRFLPGTDGPALGLFEDESFRIERLIMAPGDKLFSFTDGVTEAMDSGENLFSKDRLFGAVSGLAGSTVRDLVHGILQEVTLFSAGTTQSDDITIMALQLLRRR
jgi:serine phosphatase RsbU (regulator of sigma subunit)